ncbi:MAG: hypothetical protein ABI747_04080 [Candidatus Moraniibacteriota bacterium]
MQKQKNNLIRRRTKGVLICTLSLVLFMSVPRPAQALWSGFEEEAYKQKLEIYYDIIQGVILNQLKMQAVKLLDSSVEQLIGGVNGSGLLFISDWRQYLVDVPIQQNALYMNDFLSQTTRGKCSSLNFQSVASNKLNSNYFTYLCNQAQMTLYPGAPVVNIDEYSADPLRSLREGNWRIFNATMANPMNNPFGYALMAQQVQQQDLEARQRAAMAEGIAGQGYKGVKVGGITVTPGRTVADVVANVKTLGNNLLVNAQNPAEFISGLVTSVANRAVNQLLQRGFDQARAVIERETSRINQQVLKTSSQVNQVLGPASQYLNAVNQQVGNVNSIRTTSPGGGAPQTKGCAGTASGYGGC